MLIEALDGLVSALGTKKKQQKKLKGKTKSVQESLSHLTGVQTHTGSKVFA